MGKFPTTLKKVLIVLTVILVVVNFFVISISGYYERRLLRFISIGCYIVVFFIFRGYKFKRITLIFLFLSIVDALGLFYEYGFIDLIGPLVKLSTYILIISEVIKKVKIKNISKPISLFFAIVTLLNILLIFLIVWSTFFRNSNYIESIVYVTYGSINVGACIVALNYNFRYGTKRSIYFLYFVFALILSDVSWFMAYYLSFDITFYIDIVFYLLALHFLIMYSLATSEEEDKEMLL